MTLIDRQEPLLKAALAKIQDIRSITRILGDVDPAYTTELTERLSAEYLSIMRELAATTPEHPSVK